MPSYYRRVLQYHEFFREVKLVGFETSNDGINWVESDPYSFFTNEEFQIPKKERWLDNDK